MSRVQTLMRVEMPLAWPSVLSGMRVSSQMAMGILAIAALYAKGPGLGNLIFSGLARISSPTAIPMALTENSSSSWCSRSCWTGLPDHRTIHDVEGTRSMTGVQERSAATSSSEATGVEIVLDHVSKRYAGQQKSAVEDVSMTINAGEIVVFVGPSGCGKTTTMRMINRLIEPTSGSIMIGGRDALSIPANELRRSIGYSIQQAGLFPHMTIEQNVAMVPGLLKWNKKRISACVEEMLSLVGLDPAIYAHAGSPVSCRVASSSASASPAHSPPTRPSCSWTSRSAPSTRSPGPRCRTADPTARRDRHHHRLRHPRLRRGRQARRSDRRAR